MENGKYDPYKGENSLIIETIPEEIQTLYLQNKDFKSTVLNMFKELKETWTKRKSG